MGRTAHAPADCANDGPRTVVSQEAYTKAKGRDAPVKREDAAAQDSGFPLYFSAARLNALLQSKPLPRPAPISAAGARHGSSAAAAARSILACFVGRGRSGA